MRPGLGFGQHRPHPAHEPDDAPDWEAAHTVVDLLSGKWTIPVVAALMSGPRRHGALRRGLDKGLSDKVLTQTLRRMEADGLLARRTVEGNPPAVFYQLTPLGRSLSDPLAALAHWQAAHRP